MPVSHRYSNFFWWWTQLPETCREVEISILRSSVHLVGFIWNRLYWDVRPTKHKILYRSWKKRDCIFELSVISIMYPLLRILDLYNFISVWNSEFVLCSLHSFCRQTWTQYTSEHNLELLCSISHNTLLNLFTVPHFSSGTTALKTTSSCGLLCNWTACLYSSHSNTPLIFLFPVRHEWRCLEGAPSVWTTQTVFWNFLLFGILLLLQSLFSDFVSLP